MTNFIERVGAILEKPSKFQTPLYKPTPISNVNSNARLQWSTESTRDDNSSEISLQREYERRYVYDDSTTISDVWEKNGEQKDPYRKKNCNKAGFKNKEGNGYKKSINISKSENIGNDLYRKEKLERQQNSIKQSKSTGQNMCYDCQDEEEEDEDEEEEESENPSYSKNLSRNNPKEQASKPILKAKSDNTYIKKADQAKGKAPAKKSLKASSKSPTKTPAKTPAKAPAKTPAKAPAKAPATAPAKAPATAPAKAPEKTPEKNPEETPVKKPAKKPPVKNALLGCSNSDMKAEEWEYLNERGYGETYMDDRRRAKLKTFCSNRLPENIPEWDEYKLTSSWYYLAVKRAFCEFFGQHKVCVCTARCSKALIPLKSLPANAERQIIYENERLRRMSGKTR